MNPTLYHGTDLRMATLSEQERGVYKDDCLKAANHLWQFFEQYSNFGDPQIFEKRNALKERIPKQEYPYLYANLLDKIACYYSYINGGPMYQYDKTVIYFCTNEKLARNYAYRGFAGGEMGLVAFRMLEACKALGIEYQDTDRSTLDSIKRVEDFATSDPQPAVIPTSDYRRELLFFEDGEPFPDCFFDFFKEPGSNYPLRYCGSLILDISKAIRL